MKNIKKPRVTNNNVVSVEHEIVSLKKKVCLDMQGQTGKVGQG